jgi:hypothetical protein
MAWFWRMAIFDPAVRVIRSRSVAARRLARQILVGRRFSLSLERNREAADRLDAAINEAFRR